MSNWTTITDAAVTASKNGLLLAKVRSTASTQGIGDPLPEIVADVVATIRARCSTGNQLDADPSKIPNSLKGLALRMITRSLKDWIQMPLTADESKKAEEDSSYLNRIMDNKVRFETPDTPSGGAEMQSAGSIEITNVSDRFASRQTMNGLL